MKRALASVILVGVGAALPASGCSPAVDPAKVAAVRVTDAGVETRGCRLLGPLEGKDSDRWVPGGPRYETAMLDLRRKAVLGGGNSLVLDAVEPPRESDYMPTFVVRARLFACDTEGAASAPTAAAPDLLPKTAASPICEPDCSPGYTCLRGTCVSACNPLCPSGERCGADRVCHPVTAAPPPAPAPP